MLRKLVITLTVLVLGAGVAHGQQWAEKMFKVRRHEFGTVARGSKAVYEFEFQNIYKETIHVSGVRTSCGCTTPTLTKHTLNTWEKGSVVATYNTGSFLGRRGATITVSIDKPYPAEVQLEVAGYIRSDVVFKPGEIEFGEVNSGTPKETKVQVYYAGRSDWEVKDVRSAFESIEVELAPLSRGNGRVAYELLVRLREDAPPGYFNDHLYVVTNDQRSNIPLAISGNVVSAVTVSPASLFMGTLAPGQSVTKQLIVRGKTPFRVTTVKCEDDCFKFQLPEEPKALHIIPVTYTAEKPGKVACKISIETDLGASSAEFVASATVNEAASETTSEDG